MQDTLPAPVKPDISIVERHARASVSMRVRRPEWVILAFLVYAPLVASLLPAAPSVTYRLCWLNPSVILAYLVLIHFDSRNPRLALSVIRDWLPLGLVLLAYREMGWFALPHATAALESHWVIWDRLVLRGGAKAAIEAFGPVLPSILEIAYALVYALAPFSIAVLYIYRRRQFVDRFLFVFVLGVLLCYAQFPFWPSEPPRLVFFGQDFPSYDTVFRRFNWWMLGSCGIHTSVFPSAHVAGAFAAAFGLRQAMPRRQWPVRLLFIIAVLIAVATVYGRYHYLADATAGLLMAVVAVALAKYGLPALLYRERSHFPKILTEES
ncbi:MAG TPA: phosphatase PAP2 family protein [Bryobacteraceae bacterium]|nr:phosphatase PAP2 family protein [Bryobacteraceae bacterium]